MPVPCSIMHIALFQLLRCNTEFDGKSKTFMALNDVYVLQISQGHLVLNEIIQVCFRVSFEANIFWSSYEKL